MANPTSASYGGGVSGATTGISGGDTAVRKSVAKTQKGYGSSVSASAVYSETKNLRFAYSGVEADAPAVDRT
tara:strand:+ start:270 stop:485 length:216 start_codon:yes stop_codon:yes gene_type:complete